MKYFNIKASYEVKTPVRLPNYTGFMIRGIIGEILKKQSCIYRNNWRNAKCSICKEIKKCAYGYSFEWGKDLERRIISAMAPPRMFSLIAPKGKTYDGGEEIVIEVNIFNKKQWIVNLFSKIFENIKEIGRDRKRGYGKIELIDLKVNEREVKKSKTIGDRIRVEFITPTKIEKDKVFVLKPSFYDIMINIGRRYYAIKEIYYKEGESMQKLIKFNQFKEGIREHLNKTKLEKIKRWSEKRKKREYFSGLVGSITYSIEKQIEERELVKELIGFANVYGLGKRISAGMGRVRISSYYS